MAILREIIKIDEEKCNGCGLCAKACAEGAIEIIDGKAKLVSEVYCDGLGACIGECPEGALTIEKREAEEFDEEATEIHLHELEKKGETVFQGCPGSMTRSIQRPKASPNHATAEAATSQLSNWPVQLMLISPNAPYLQGADLLLTADCVPFALADFHTRFLNGKPVVIGCPKLDDGQYYVEKLTEIFKKANINSLTIVHMEVPCCFGLSNIVSKAMVASGKNIPVDDYTVSIQGEVLV